MPFLEVSDGSESLALADRNLLGRGDEADIRVDDRGASREHALIERRSGTWMLRDLASANGTRVNGADVTQKKLEDGDVIAIGEVELTFRAGPAASAESAAPRTRAKRGSKTPIFLGLALAVVGLLVWQATSGSEDGANSGEESGTKVAEVRSTDDSPSPGTAESADEGAKADESAAAALRNEFAEMRAQDADRGLADLRFDYDALARRASPALAAEIRGHIDQLEERVKAEASLRLGAAVEEARREGAKGNWGAALSGFDEVLLSLRVAGLDETAREGLRRRLELVGEARQSWLKVAEASRTLVAEGRGEAAREALSAGVEDFRGLNFEALARTELRLLDLRLAAPVASAESQPRGDAARGRTRQPDEGAGLATAARADRAAADRRWKEAAGLYEEAMKAATESALRARYRDRAALMLAYESLKAQVVAAVGTEEGLRGLKVGRITARPESADDERIVLRVGRRGEVTWTWREMTPDRLLGLFERVTRPVDSKLDFARVAFDLDRDAAAEAMLVRAVKKKEAKPLADEIVAMARGEDLPEGGYRIYQGRFLGPQAWNDAQERIRAERLARDLPRARGRRYEELLGELTALGESAREPFREGLVKRLEDRAKRARGLACFAKPAKARRQLTSVIEGRRQVAFALIFDTERYPYPYGPNQKEVQAEVDSLTGKVRAIWDRPEEAWLELDENWAALRQEMQALESRITGLGAAVETVTQLDEELRRALDPKKHSWTTQERDKIEEVTTFNAEIKSSIIPEERSCHEHTNAYRMMMGLMPVKIDEALVLAARSHSQEMKDLGYFSHTSPIPDRSSPSKRAQIAGWGGGVSENIARGQGSGEAAVRGWISSSGHHRNILGSRHTHLGCGKAKDGFFWTQNFGTGASSSISREKIDPKESTQKSR
jgi:cysteine-rich secretory family protein/FHA domain-containing protein